jgi:uncharacterized membrane protein
MFRKISVILLAIFFSVAGTAHFITPATYLPLMPDYLPWHLALIYLSGVAEILGGVGLLWRCSRLLAGWWLIAVLVAVFPANIHMLTHQVPLLGQQVPLWIFWLRLPLQLLMILWIYACCICPAAGKRATW